MLQVQYKNFNIKNLRKNLLKYGIVVIKNCEFNSPKHFSNLLKDFELFNVKSFNLNDNVQILNHNQYLGNENWDWHNDRCYTNEECIGTALLNIKNGHLSPTWIMDMRSYPKSFYKKYQNITSHFVHSDLLNPYLNQESLPSLKEKSISRNTVIDHPYTKEKLLYASPFNNTINVSDIVDYANKHCYKHNWEENDLLIWDNISTMHKRFKFEGERKMWRIQFLI